MKKITKLGEVKEVKLTLKQQERKLKNAVKLLNELVAVQIQPSPIHGVGVFAIRNIKKGKPLNLDAIPHAFDVPYLMFNELKPKVREILLGHWPQIVNGSHFLYPVTKMTAFLNHSDNPNYDAKADKTLRDIKEGEEITEDYRKIENYDKIFDWLK